MNAGLDVKERMKENMDAGIERRMDEKKYGYGRKERKYKCWI